MIRESTLGFSRLKVISINLKPEKIFGLSLYYPYAAAALSTDGERIPAVQEERFTHKKHVSNFPDEALKDYLQSNKFTLNDIAHIVCYEKHLLAPERLTETCLGATPRGRRLFFAVMQAWVKEKLFLQSEIKNQLNNFQGKIQETAKELFYVPEILLSELHLIHAILAFHTSPIQEAVIVCMDRERQ